MLVCKQTIFELQIVDFTFDIEIHVGGYFVEEPTIIYVGGSVRLLTKLDPDKLSFFEIRDLCHLVGAPKEHSIYKCLLPESDLQDDLRDIEIDADVLNMTTLHRAWPAEKIIVYTEINVEPLAVEYPDGRGVADGGIGGGGGVADGGVGGDRLGGVADGVGGDAGGDVGGDPSHANRSTSGVRTRGQLAAQRPPKMNSVGGKRKE
nr:hypothetical protein CFP56_23494 [Quercus suber]